MSIFQKLRNLIEEPPPAFAFEIGPVGIAHWQASASSTGTRFESIPDLAVDADLLGAHLRQIAPPANGNRRRPATVILPDRAARVTLMDFDTFPRKAEEQISLIRFRLKRTVPFDVDTAILRYQARSLGGTKVDLTVAAVAVETIAPYEAAFRNSGFQPGYITVAALSAANLAAPNTVTLRLNGPTLTLSHFEGTELALYRCLELQAGTLDEVLNVLEPTLAYLEDERKLKPARIDLCGLGSMAADLDRHIAANWGVPTQPLRSRLGAVEATNAGLLGYLEAAGVN